MYEQNPSIALTDFYKEVEVFSFLLDGKVDQ
jgi:hypothetical protein